MGKLKILLLEDEQRAGEKLRDLILKKEAEVSISWYRSVLEGKAYLQSKEKVDLIFSDIQLLDGNAFEIYDDVKIECPIVFCTAYDQYYLQAFQTTGIGYLLKPYTEEQFDQLWEKYLQLFSKENQLESNQLIQQLSQLLSQSKKQYKQHFTVKKTNGIFILKATDVSYFQAQGDFVFAFDNNGQKHILNQSLNKIEERLDPSNFFQINRSEIVQLSAILKYDQYIKNRLAISLKNTTQVLHTSNSRSANFKKWIEGN